jgi:hypothetical protein
MIYRRIIFKKNRAPAAKRTKTSVYPSRPSRPSRGILFAFQTDAMSQLMPPKRTLGVFSSAAINERIPFPHVYLTVNAKQL